jgi:hypothetical protein
MWWNRCLPPVLSRDEFTKILQMERNEDTLPVSPDIQIKPQYSRWRFGLMGWFLLFGLAILCVGIFVEADVLGRRTLNRILYHLDPRCWSLSLIPILWGLVCWFATAFVSYFTVIRKKRIWIRLIIVLAVFYGLAFFSGGWSFQKIGKEIYFSIYLAYVIGPTANYMATGIWNWKMFVMPVSALVMIVFLLYITVKNRRKKREK